MLHFLIVIFFLKFGALVADDSVVVPVQTAQTVLSCCIDLSDASYQQKLNLFLPDHCMIQSVQYQVDGFYDPEELTYLTGICEQAFCPKKDILNALFYLQQSQKFANIQLEIIAQPAGLNLVFKLIKNQILTRIFIAGMLRGKEQLKNHYLIDLGDAFDLQKHHHSVDEMINYLKGMGYFKAYIADSVEIDSKTKDVFVRCIVKKGFKFHIARVGVCFDHVGTVAQEEIIVLQKQLQVLARAKLKNKYYSSQLVASIVQKMKHVLEHHGCIDFDLQVQQTMHDELKRVDINFFIKLERKREFVFSGNTFFTQEQIIDHLLLYGKSTWHFPSALIIDEIGQLYKNKGFWNVHITVREEKDRVFCFIKEGARVKISDIQFKNNTQISQTKLIKDVCAPFLKAKYFDKDLFKKLLDLIVKTYKQAGFWDIKIIKDEFIPAVTSNTYTLFLTLQEGSRRELGTVTVSGYPEVEQSLQFLCVRNVGQGFDSSLLQEHRQWIVRFLRNKGHQKVVVDYVLQESNGIVDVIWKLELSESTIKIGKTIIVGNTKVAHKLLMQEVVHDYGDGWDKKKIEKTLANFRVLPIFESVQVYPGSQLDVDLFKPVFVKLIEDDRYEVKTRFGMQQVGRNLQFHRGFTYKLGATLCLKNPFHIADQCLFEGDITRFYRNLSGSYDIPWLFGKKIGCQFKLYDNSYHQPVYIGSQDGLYNATQQGFLWSMNHTRDNKRLGQFVLNGLAGLEFLGLFEAEQPELGRIIDYDPLLLAKKIGYLFVQPTVLWQKVDNLLNPHSGHMSFLSCKGFFDLDSKTSFFKVLIEHTQYFSVANAATVAVRARLGHVFNRYFDQINPIERFYLGGACSLRGYERDYCPPYGLLTKPIYDQHAGLPPCADDIWRYAPQGGRSLFNLNAELRLNVYKNFGVVIFNDIGALFKHSIYDELKSWRDSFFAGSGFGLRYDTPIGPARFDVGFKWKQQYPDFEARCVWYVTLGQAF